MSTFLYHVRVQAEQRRLFMTGDKDGGTGNTDPWNPDWKDGDTVSWQFETYDATKFVPLVAYVPNQRPNFERNEPFDESLSSGVLTSLRPAGDNTITGIVDGSRDIGPGSYWFWLVPKDGSGEELVRLFCVTPDGGGAQPQPPKKPRS